MSPVLSLDDPVEVRNTTFRSEPAHSVAVDEKSLAGLTSVPLDALGPVVGYRLSEGHWHSCSWMGPTREVWARFQPGEMPPLAHVRQVMVAAYEPTGGQPPAGLIPCRCFLKDPTYASEVRTPSPKSTFRATIRWSGPH